MKEIEVRRDRGQVDEGEINKFEQTIGFRFPQTYKSILSKHNALCPRKPDFKFVDSSTGKVVSRDVTFFGYGDSLPRSNRIADAQDNDVYGHDGVVNFGNSANGDFISFDYRSDPKSDDPRVVSMFHDVADGDGKMLINFVANSFEEFLDLLYRSDD